MLIGFLVLLVLLLAGFGTLVFMAEGMDPGTEEVRVELEDNFPR
jgi:ABC-type transporter Mla subunit MlaD|tara:strand:+ start:1914 stop:2045 length:132 start_codon:yes stop_codon:yes gene_type:complete